MKVLLADAFEQSGLSALEAGGCEIVYRPDLKDAALVEALRSTGAQVLVVRSTKVTADMLQSPALALVVRAGAGYNTIDVAAASRRGIYVANCPGKNAIAETPAFIGHTSFTRTLVTRTPFDHHVNRGPPSSLAVSMA